MLKQYQTVIGGVFRLVDAGVIVIAWILAYWFRFELPFIEVTKGLPEFSTYVALSPVILGVWFFTFSALGVYQSRRMLRRTQEVGLILRAHGVALVVFIVLTFLFSEYRYSRAVIMVFALFGAVLLVLFRLALRNLLRKLRSRGFNLRYAIWVGEGPVLNHVIERIRRFPELGIRVLGVVTQNEDVVLPPGIERIGGLGELKDLIAKFRPDQLFIALPRSQSAELQKILSSIQDETLEVQLIPDISDYVILGCQVEEFEGIPIVRINDSPLSGWGAIAKRITDIVISILAIIVLMPVFLLIALLIKLTSPGPVFYSQERMGLDRKTFKMLKFRSMKIDAEAASGAVWARPNDDRRTRIGAFLRSTSLDELPQLWNVLKGEMSLVGPRPERPVFVDQFRQKIPNYMLRHKVKAGMTGWAQVNGWRGNTSLESRIECDLYYIRNWSYFFDLKIMWMTVWKGFVNRNAY
jgi:Undecaprenyl-phosphate glucose phosphotransferase